MSTNCHTKYQSSTHLVGNIILTDVNCNLSNNFSFCFTPTSLSPMILGIHLQNNTALNHPPTLTSVVLDDVPHPNVPLGENLLALTGLTHGDVSTSNPLSGFHPPSSPTPAPQDNEEEVPKDLPSLIPIEETANGAYPFLPGMFDRISFCLQRPFVNVTFAETSKAFIHAQHNHPTHPRDYNNIPHRYIIHGHYNRHNNPPPCIITRMYTIKELEPVTRQLNEDSILNALAVPKPQDLPRPTLMETLNAASTCTCERDQSPDVKPEPFNNTTMVVEDHEALSKKSSSPNRVWLGNPHPYSLPNMSSPVPVDVSLPILGISHISGLPDPHGNMDGLIMEPETCSMTELYAGKHKASEMSNCNNESDERIARRALLLYNYRPPVFCTIY
ncbi:hypothetical protein CONPUDRAFT_153823 [Coniophora puteana RWD-64-598 SS2]|uniref:Uncharacterized protein n=1 Tax=Coniophora puteana (strain RWD-64-598) TaxID=741705 RepID=A0A5M3MQ49_CONPW|nr:uncharacterized protein CONPUDRAFT_153823 [Coniophora puteana RWD-64-598 SS2]EIW81273.1 hypothetical protein CONPUDRAFT_153823 [Coniophora puteana RWD-64-598 SS2]